MRPTHLAVLAAVTAVVAALLPTTPASAVVPTSHTWVSGTGDDANPCSRTAPCKTFAGAISRTPAGGSINILDPGGYGSVTVTKAITLDGTGSLGSILTSSGANGIVVNAGPDDDVVLRNLDLSGTGCNGNVGITILRGRSLTLDHVRIAGFRTAISYTGSNNDAGTTFRLTATHVDLASDCTTGLDLSPAADRPVRAVLADSSITGSGTAVRAATGATATLSRSIVTGNQQGVDLSAGGVVHAGCGTTITANRVNGAPTDTTCATGGTATPTTADPTAPTSATPTGGAARTWISGVGDDVNPCSRTAPCLTLAGAATKTSAGGYVDALDPVSAGALTLTKALTIDGAGSYLGIRATSGSGLVINAGPHDDVVLHDVVLDGVGCSGVTGIRILGGRSLTLDHVRISGFQTAISYEGTGGAPFTVSASSLDVSGACSTGLALNAGPGPVQVSLDDAVISTSGTALAAGPGAEVWATRTTLALNGTGLAVTGGKVHAGCDSESLANTTDGSFTDNLCATTPSTPAAPTTPTPTTSQPVGTTAQGYCVVPRLKNKKVAVAKRTVTAAGCTVKVKKRHAAPRKHGKVLSQSFPAGYSVTRGTRVVIVVGR